jgi:hypothetical protein
MNKGRRSITAAFAVLGLTILALAPAAAADHSVVDLASSGGNGAYNAFGRGISEDGSHVFFVTDERLVSADTDSVQDVYEHAGGVTSLVSAGGNGSYPAHFDGSSANGSRVFFSTNEPLDVNLDANNTQDVYERAGGITRIISTGATGTSGGANFIRASQSGDRVFFTTARALDPADTDGQQDIYVNAGGTTTWVSTGPAGGNAVGGSASLDAISSDGTRAFFRTAESLVTFDADGGQPDVYERSGGTTTLISTASANDGFGTFMEPARIAQDGARVFFTTDASLLPSDMDTEGDVYEHSGGTITLVSTGPSGGNGAFDAHFTASSEDGARVFFYTDESLVASDTDQTRDVYQRSSGTTSLISIGPTGANGLESVNPVAVSADGSRVVFHTSEAMVASDTDSMNDLYERAGGTTSLISTGPAGGNGTFHADPRGTSRDLSRVFFTTDESLVSADTDGGASDIYERSGGATTLVSTSPLNPHGTHEARFEGSSQDGSRVVFSSVERFLGSDTDPERYGTVYFNGIPFTVSIGSWEDVYVASTGNTTGFARPKGASPLLVPLVPVYKECTSGNTTHGAPLAFESCNPPVPASDYLTVGTPDANSQVANSVGSLKLRVILGNPSTPADEADIGVDLSLTDVRKQSDLSDYAGPVSLKTSLRITDRSNGSSQTVPGTVADIPLSFSVGCAATASTTIGSTCSVSSTLDALIGDGVVKESKRSIFKLVGDIEVWDPGADGNLGTSGDNTLFAGSGLFVP